MTVSQLGRVKVTPRCAPGVRDARLLLKLKQIPRGTARGREKKVVIFFPPGAPGSRSWVLCSQVAPSFGSPAEGAPARKKRARAHNSQAREPARHLPLHSFYPRSGHHRFKHCSITTLATSRSTSSSGFLQTGFCEHTLSLKEGSGRRDRRDANKAGRG